jgi:hypothetical protein
MKFPTFLEVKLNGYMWREQNMLSFEKIKPQARKGTEKKTHLKWLNDHTQ